MTLARLLYIMGIVLVVYALISGFHFHYSSSEAGSSFTSGYSFKIGTFLLGLFLLFLGKRSDQKNSNQP